MHNDFDMIVKHIYSNDDFIVYPIADLHVGAKEFMSGKWTKFKKQILQEPNSYIVLAGDLINNATRSSVSNVYEDVMRPCEQKKWVAEQLFDIRDKILAVVPGNHEKRNRDVDDNPAYDICAKLDIEDRYRENIAFVKLQVGNITGAGKKNPTYTIGVAHGKSETKIEKFQYIFEGLDCLITGHTHSGKLKRPQRVVVDKHNNKVTLRDFVPVCCTSWLLYGGYAIDNMYQPHSNRLQKIMFNGSEKDITTIW